MAEHQFLDSIYETEGVAEEILFNAKARRKEIVENARAQAEEIHEKARTKAAADHKAALRVARDEGVEILAGIREDASREADRITESAGAAKAGAVRIVAEGIVKYCADC